MAQSKAAWIVSALILACGAVENAPADLLGPIDVVSAEGCTFPDGSNSCDGGPVLARELEGLWCQDAYFGPDASQAFCLLFEKAYNPDGSRIVDGRMLYRRESANCSETGHATGGLEFWPDEQHMCLPGSAPLGMYSVSVDWTDTGIALFFDDRHVERYTYVGN